jgi:hypothetical protein
MDQRRARQAMILNRKRSGFANVRRAARLSVRYFDQDLLGGWHTYLDGVGFSVWVRPGSFLVGDILARFPVSEPSLFSEIGLLEDWMPTFAKRHQRGVFCGKPRGVAYCWIKIYGGYPQRILRPIA